MDSIEQNGKTKLVTTVLAVLVIAGIIVVIDHLKTEGAEAPLATTNSASSQTLTPTTSDTSAGNAATTNTETTTATSNYKDGTYTATSNYYVPHGYENITVRLTLKNGIITGSDVANSEGDRDSAAYQESFASEYKSYVVGKKISGLELNTISGASDTTQGFNEALSKIASQAQA